MVDPDGVRTDAILVASPHGNAKHVLAITCVAIPSLDRAEIFLFHGGFDAPETMTDPTKEAGFWHFYIRCQGRQCAGTARQRGLRSETIAAHNSAHNRCRLPALCPIYCVGIRS